MLRLVAAAIGLCTFSVAAAERYPAPHFIDAARGSKLLSSAAAIDRVFQDYAREKKIPGMVWGVVIDEKLAHTGMVGVRDRESDAPVEAATVFRIASMTKSFTALAILKLRDEGKLSLEDPVARWIPEFAHMPLPTNDTAPIRIRQLMSHSAGFPEDNPWGDRQLAASDADLTGWLRLGIPFSTPPDTRYEYSNYAFGLLGRVVTKASGMPYERYVKTEILEKLGMTSSAFEFASVPADKRAKGYRLRPDGSYLEEAPLPHGAFGAMGGLLTNAADLGKYVAFHLSAWPPRDESDKGPVRRGSVREMNHLWRSANLTLRDGNATASGYGYGLRISSDCRFELMAAHGGGLPGFGSYMLWLPDYGVGLFAMANLTYAGPAEPINRALDIMRGTGGLELRQLPASSALTGVKESIARYWRTEDAGGLRDVAALNLLLDEPVEQRLDAIRQLKREVGDCDAPGEIRAENWLRGQFNMSCAKGTVGVFYTMAPTQPPSIQHLTFRRIPSENTQLIAPTGAPAGVSCAP